MYSRTCSRLPEWIKVRLPREPSFGRTRGTVEGLGLETVCRSARCPNIFECYAKGTATFLIMGPQCTRSCAFCTIGRGVPKPLQADEPERIARAVELLGLTHVVITSVTRDDLADGGSAQFAATIETIRMRFPAVKVEVLIPDLRGDWVALRRVVDAGPDILAHNVETVPGLYPVIRPQAVYQRSLELLSLAKSMGQELIKSGMMVGLGEEMEEVRTVLEDLAGASCDMVTVGQYLRPSMHHAKVVRYVLPKEFEQLASWGQEAGIPKMLCGPLVRSSYHAQDLAERAGAIRI
jgi:lipoyl synthase